MRRIQTYCCQLDWQNRCTMTAFVCKLIQRDHMLQHWRWLTAILVSSIFWCRDSNLLRTSWTSLRVVSEILRSLKASSALAEEILAACSASRAAMRAFSKMPSYTYICFRKAVHYTSQQILIKTHTSMSVQAIATTHTYNLLVPALLDGRNITTCRVVVLIGTLQNAYMNYID